MTIGSDWGAGESPDILPCLGGIVDGVGEGDRAVGRESEFGSIEVGKRANFIAVYNDLSLGRV